MRRTSSNPALASLALALLLGLPAAARAGEPGETAKEKDKKVDRQIVTVRMLPGQDEPEVKVIPFDGKPVPRGYLGVGLTDMTPELRTHFGVPEDSGVLVSKVEPGSPAEKAGVKVGDIITSFDGKSIETSFDLRQRVREADEGEQAPIEVWRNGRAQTLTATLEKRDRPELDLGPMFFRRGKGDRVMLLGEDGEKLLPMDDILKRAEVAPRVRLQSISTREAELEKRLKELEKRIQELERQLAKR